MECHPLLDEFPTVPETVKAIKLLSSGKALELAAIPEEIYKEGVISQYVEKRSSSSKVQGFNNYPPIQKERESSSLWQASRHLFIVNRWEFHDSMLAWVQNDGEFSDPFPVSNGVKQGCVLASTLFSMMFSVMLTDAFQDSDNGIPISYRFDGKLFNLRRLQAKSKVQTEMIDEFLIADDMAKGAPIIEKNAKMVWIKYLIHVTAMISQSASKKTEVVYQPAPGKPYKEPTITVKGQWLQVVDKFTCLEAHCLELCTLMTKSMPELPKL